MPGYIGGACPGVVDEALLCGEGLGLWGGSVPGGWVVVPFMLLPPLPPLPPSLTQIASAALGRPAGSTNRANCVSYRVPSTSICSQLVDAAVPIAP